ncbi:hypothetical protein PHLGIDRAFT_16376 [Phlebiopsis gigantea 11061_1 CR5-6]|uniref:Uncharacterized protein n=1 Tax=Phlebiopsis gigantea (strain 11061_1 CR5-6) TaxID=745531 RepID=A0A0C3S3Z7_PHLG1|nr:hypothetical protein PHLGIDRAFT_16376 [Phlebiopsis gigantea 11061_1 CR5-6]
MALQFGVELQREDLRECGVPLQQALGDLLNYRSISATSALPSPSLRAALDTFTQRNEKLALPELIKMFDQFAAAGIVEGPLRANDAHAIQTLRRWYDSRRPVRQTAVLPVYRLEELALSLHELPQEGSMTVDDSSFQYTKGLAEKEERK